MLAGGIAALLASTCCLGPLVLISVGISGAWIGNLTLLEPWRPVFIGVALVAMLFAYRRIFRATDACTPGEVCARPRVSAAYQILFWVVSGLILVAFAFPWFLPYFY